MKFPNPDFIQVLDGTVEVQSHLRHAMAVIRKSELSTYSQEFLEIVSIKPLVFQNADMVQTDTTNIPPWIRLLQPFP